MEEREREKERKRRFLPLSAKENAPFLRIREEISDRTERAQQPAGPASGGGSGAISMHGFAPEMEPFPFPSPESRSLLFFHRKVRRKLFKLFAFKAGMLSWFPSIAHLGTGALYVSRKEEHIKMIHHLFCTCFMHIRCKMHMSINDRCECNSMGKLL